MNKNYKVEVQQINEFHIEADSEEERNIRIAKEDAYLGLTLKLILILAELDYCMYLHPL